MFTQLFDLRFAKAFDPVVEKHYTVRGLIQVKDRLHSRPWQLITFKQDTVDLCNIPLAFE